MSKFAKKKLKNIKKIDYVDYYQIDNLKGSYDWIFACPVETSTGFKIPILNLYKFKKNEIKVSIGCNCLNRFRKSSFI